MADEKVGYTLLFLGILLATLSVRADRLQSLLIGPEGSSALRVLLLSGGSVFLGAAGVSLVFAAHSRTLSADTPMDVSPRLSDLAPLEAGDLMEDVARRLYHRAEIALRKLSLLRQCLVWAAAALMGWLWVLLVSLVF
ncbi:MAG TPA: hypothetical protein VLT62_15345 [Candidatus Methylomirabilis sp.]|nr:hypothetical protein [Candidatus Methylomirabilis sp.]